MGLLLSRSLIAVTGCEVVVAALVVVVSLLCCLQGATRGRRKLMSVSRSGVRVVTGATSEKIM